MKKKLLCFLMFIVTIMLSGCNVINSVLSTNNTITGNEGTTTVKEETTTTLDEIKEKADELDNFEFIEGDSYEISVWVPTLIGVGNAIADLAASFENYIRDTYKVNTNITVTLQSTIDVINEKLSMAFVTNNQEQIPDIVMIRQKASLYDNDYFMPLNSFILSDKYGNISSSDYYITPYEQDEEVMSLPLMYSANVLYYDIDLANKLGVDINNLDVSTYEKLYTLCKNNGYNTLFNNSPTYLYGVLNMTDVNSVDEYGFPDFSAPHFMKAINYFLNFDSEKEVGRYGFILAENNEQGYLGNENNASYLFYLSDTHSIYYSDFTKKGCLEAPNHMSFGDSNSTYESVAGEYELALTKKEYASSNDYNSIAKQILAWLFIKYLSSMKNYENSSFTDNYNAALVSIPNGFYPSLFAAKESSIVEEYKNTADEYDEGNIDFASASNEYKKQIFYAKTLKAAYSFKDHVIRSCDDSCRLFDSILEYGSAGAANKISLCAENATSYNKSYEIYKNLLKKGKSGYFLFSNSTEYIYAEAEVTIEINNNISIHVYPTEEMAKNDANYNTGHVYGSIVCNASDEDFYNTFIKEYFNN